MIEADSVHSTPPLNSSSIYPTHIPCQAERSPWIRLPLTPPPDSLKRENASVSTVSPLRAYPAA
jgi:hypothetical protein